MSAPTATTAWSGGAWSCTVRVVVDDPQALPTAIEELTALLARVDRAASRFRADSDLTLANERAGRPTPVSPLLVDLVTAALDAACTTDGAVDPTLGRVIKALGYDRDIELVRADPARDGGAPSGAAVLGGLWPRVRCHRDISLLTVPVGAALDLGSTAKAWTADRAARTIAERCGTGVLVELGGDLAVAGHRDGGWAIRVAEREGGDGQVVNLTRGGLATSTTTVRTWRQGDTVRHHVVDPRTGLPVDGPWRTASVHAPSAFDANVAATAALVLGADAVEWLTARGTAARLVGRDGEIVTTPGWPGHAVTPSAVTPTGTNRTSDGPVCAMPARSGPSRTTGPRTRVITLHRRSVS